MTQQVMKPQEHDDRTMLFNEDVLLLSPEIWKRSHCTVVCNINVLVVLLCEEIP